MECEISLQYEYIIEIDLKSTHLETDCGRLEKADAAQVTLGPPACQPSIKPLREIDDAEASPPREW